MTYLPLPDRQPDEPSQHGAHATADDGGADGRPYPAADGAPDGGADGEAAAVSEPVAATYALTESRADRCVRWVGR